MKELHPVIYDDIYPLISKEQATRYAVRAILLNDKNEVLLHHIKATDMFGERDHYELPGGGIKSGESHLDALKREIEEECGYSIKDIFEVGQITIEYHLLKRFDLGYFYCARMDKPIKKSLTNLERTLIYEDIFVPIEKIKAFYSEHIAYNVGRMIHERDLCAILEAASLLNSVLTK